MTDGRLVLICSYPKSGNSWMRALLTNYVEDGAAPSSINRLEGRVIASSRRLFDEWVGVEASDLTREEIERYRPQVYRGFAKSTSDVAFMKVHDGYLSRNGQPLFPPDVAATTIYVIRNPLDVVVSLANWAGLSLDESVDRLSTWRVLAESTARLSDQLEQMLPPWGEHVRGWVEDAVPKAHVVRFEDLLRSPEPAFGGVIRAVGLELDGVRLSKAISFAAFDRLREQEETGGFAEHRPDSSPFFRRGIAGEWRERLGRDHVRRVVADHGHMMRRFGYLETMDGSAC